MQPIHDVLLLLLVVLTDFWVLGDDPAELRRFAPRRCRARARGASARGSGGGLSITHRRCWRSETVLVKALLLPGFLNPGRSGKPRFAGRSSR